MNALHILEEDKQHLYFHIIQIGAGANGGQFFRSLCQDIATYFRAFREAERKGNSDQVTFGVDLTICDADEFESKNLLNQICTEEDIGEYKVEALAERYADVYDISVKAVTQYIKNIEMLNRLFEEMTLPENYQYVKVLVGMVDNNKTRQLLHDYFYSDKEDTLIWIDAGVTGVEVIESPNEEDIEMIQKSGFSGQIVTGFKYNGEVILEPVTDCFPDMLEDAASHFPDESCGEIIIDNPQRSATNRMAAVLANNIMNNLFHSQRIYNHIVPTNAQTCASGGRASIIKPEQLKCFEEVKYNKQGDDSDGGT